MTTLLHGIAETTITTGTGMLSLGGAVPGAVSFSARYAVGATVPYLISNGTSKEWGIGTVGAGNTLARTTITGTLVGGVYTVGGTAIPLAGASQVEAVEHEGNDFQTSMAAHVIAASPHGNTYTTPAQAAAAAPVQSVAGKTGAVVLAPADVVGFNAAAAAAATTQVANYAALPGTGVVGVIYVTLNNGLSYLWSGSAYTRFNRAVVNVEDFGAKGDGVTDDTPALNSAMAYLAAGNGGIIDFQATTYLFSSTIRPPYVDDPTYPKMKPLYFRGKGCHWNTGEQATAAINGSTVFDMRGGTAYGKVQLRGLGIFKSTGITYTNLGTPDTYPLIYTTNTTLHLSGNAFYGAQSLVGTACNQDAIVMGGTVATIGNAETSAFQGYGTVIEKNYFNHVQRAVYGRTYCNSTVVRDNTIWLQCGSNLGGGAAIEFDGDPTLVNYAVGNSIVNNLIEMYNYTYSIRMKMSSNSYIAGNSGWDGSPQNQAVVYLENSSYQNTVIGAEGVPGKPYFLEGNPGANGNTYLGTDTSAKNGQIYVGQQGATTFTGAAALWSTTVAALTGWTHTPTYGLAFATNGRKSAEGAGAGTGVPAWFDGTNWRTFYDNSIVAA